jgi:RHS repeat-associated protein
MLSAVDTGNNINYVTGAIYGPDGSLLSYNNGWTTSFAGIANSFTYSTRLQPVYMTAVSPGTTGTNATASVTIGGTLNSLSSGGGNPPLAASNSPLTSFVDGNGNSHAFYLSSNQHVWHLFWNNSGGWQNQDLTVNTGAPLAAAASSMTSLADSSGVQRVYYLDSNQHLHEMNCCGAGWSDNDMTAYLGTSAATSGSALASTGSGQGSTVHVYYQGGNQHLYHMYLSSSGVWNSQDVTAVTSTWSCSCSVVNAPAAGSALTSVVDSGGVVRVYFLDSHQHLNETYNTGSGWYNTDMTVFLSTSAAASGSALVSTVAAQGATVNVYYQGGNQHLNRMFLGWQVQDVTAATGSAGPASGSAISSMIDNGGLIRTYFLDANQHVHETWCCSSGSYSDTDMTAHYNFTGAATGSALTSLGMAGNPVHVHYEGANQHIWHMYLSSAGGWTNEDTSSLATVTLPDSGTVGLNVGSFTATACFGSSTNSVCTGQPVNTTPAQVATALAQSLNASNSPVTATASGATINMTWKATGPFTTPVSALSTMHDNPSLFSSPSFASQATSFSNGTGANLAVFNIGYDFHLGNGDNGNVYGIANYRDQSRNQTFTYDALNRLTSAQNAGTDCTQKTVNGATKYWGNSYGYDAWGNLLQKTVTKCSAENLSVAALTNNQLVGYTYDAAGNMAHDATTGNNYSYDQENRITGAAGYTYTYDANGNRVEKSNGTMGTIYWYMTPGIVAESDLTGTLKSEYVFFDGDRVARKDFPGGAVSYYFSDHLKTAAVIADSAGNIKEDEDYYPWGGELQFVNSDPNHYKFTGKERDSETQLDYFGARYYGNWLGRFITPDWSAMPVPVPYADLSDPQSLNQYSYVRNIPTVRVDPTGHCDIDGEHHGFWWCVGHALGFTQTAKEIHVRAENDRKFFREHKIFREDGTRVDPDKLSDQQVIDEATALNLAYIAGKLISIEGHHLLPQEFRQKFEEAGLDIDSDEYIREISKQDHRLKPDGLHTGTGRGGDYNQAWRDFFARNPNATKAQILQQLDIIMRQFGLK